MIRREREFLKLKNKLLHYQKQLESYLKSGQFWKFSTSKKQMVLKRLEKFRRKLSLFEKKQSIAFSIAISAALPLSYGQFSLNTYENPLSMDIGSYSTSEFVDIDADGDFDAFLGESVGTIKYYENTGSNTAPAFVARTGTDNPLNSVSVVNYSRAGFADFDGDNDQDAFISDGWGLFYYWENTGSNVAPAFTERTGTDNPMNGFDVGDFSNITVADLDDDGDTDILSGERFGAFVYYENTGSSVSPKFVNRTGTDNPLNGESIANFNCAPDLFDYDNDGDFDLTGGDYFSGTDYWENTGSAASPGFIKRTGTDNPFNSITDYGYSSPSAIDIDGNGVQDIFMGNSAGNFYFLQKDGTVFLPVELIEFCVKYENDAVVLCWSTGSEINNDRFEVQRSADGIEFETIGIVEGAGNSESPLEYKYIDDTPLTSHRYYRLIQVDFDGKQDDLGTRHVNTESQSVTLIYPNPVTNHRFNVVLEQQLSESSTIRLIATDGRSLRYNILNMGDYSFQINLEDQLFSGICFLHILDQNGSVATVKKVIVD